MSKNVRFSARQLRFIDWLATTKYDRLPATQGLLAQELGLNPRTLTRWKKDKDLQEAVLQRARELLGDDLPEIYGALRREASKGSYQHIRLALEMTGEYVPTDRHEHGGIPGQPVEMVTHVDIGNLSDAELDTLAGVAQRIRKAGKGAGEA